jgi:hypothetical protein
MSEHIGFRCPDDLVEAIKVQMEVSGKSRTEVLVDLLRVALPATRQAIPDIDSRLSELEQRLSERIAVLEQAQLGKSRMVA